MTAVAIPLESKFSKRLALVMLLAVSFFVFQFISVFKDRQGAVEREHYFDLCRKAISFTLLKQGRPDFDGEEGVWRDALKSRAGDPTKDKYFGAYEAKLADALYSRALYFQSPIPEEVEPLFKDALRLFEKNFGHVDGSYYQLRLANLYYSQGRYDEAERLFKRHLNALKKKDGEDSWGVREDSYELAKMYESLNRYSEAEALLANAVRVCKKNHPEDFSTPFTLNELANLYYRQGRGSDAIPLFKEVISINGRDFSDVGLNLGRAQHRAGQDNEAESRLKNVLNTRRQCLRIDSITRKQERLPDDASYHGPVILALGQVYASQGRYAEAEAYLKEAIELNEKALAGEAPISTLRARQQDLRIAGKDLAQTYLECGRAEDAKFIQKRLFPLTKPNRFGTAEVKSIPGALRG